MAERNVDIRSLTLHPQAHLIPAMRSDEWRDFYQDVAFRGIKVPLEVLADGTIVDGRHRYRAAQEMGLAQVPVVDAVLGSDDSLTYMLKAAVLRRHLNDDQRAMMAYYWKQEHKETAGRPTKEEQKNADTRVSALDRHPTETRAAESFNVSPNAIKKSTYVANRNPELAQQVHSGELPLNQAWREVKRAERHEEISSYQPPELSTLIDFDILYVDPPWRYEHIATESRAIENQYPTMSLDEIKSLEIPAAADAVLFLWAPSPKLEEAVDVIKAWGFSYRTCMVWAKDQIGMGYYVRQQHELLLIAKRGNPPMPDPSDRPPSVVNAPRAKHSEKPEEFYHLIERMYPTSSKVELFSRNQHPGWAAWGNEIA